MDRANFLNYERFIADSETWAFVQQMIQLVSGMAVLGGDNYILSGCEVTGSSVAPGIIVVNGEIMPFAGGTLADNVIINETTESVSFGDIDNPDLYIKRVAVFGTNPDSHRWSSFVRITSLAEMQKTLVPKGAIMMWAGTTAPAGWAICDGTQGTPDLQGRFILGAGKRTNPPADDDNPSLAVGEIGGYGKVRLQAGQAGSFTVTNRWEDSQDLGGGKYLMGKIRFNNNVVLSEDGSQHGSAQGDNVVSGTAQKIQIQQADNAHENRPPYYVLAYIQKL